MKAIDVFILTDPVIAVNILVARWPALPLPEVACQHGGTPSWEESHDEVDWLVGRSRYAEKAAMLSRIQNGTSSPHPRGWSTTND